MIRLLHFLRPFRTLVALVLALTFVQTTASLYLPTLTANIVDTGVVKGNVTYIIQIGSLMLGITLLGAAAAALSSLFGSRATAGFGQRLRSAVFSHVQQFTLRGFDQIGTSSLIVRTTNDVMQVQQLVNMMLSMMVMAPLTAIGGIVLALYTDARLAVIAFLAIPVLGLAIYLLMRRGLGLFSTMQVKVDRLNLVLRENLTGVRVIRAFDRVPFEVDRFDQGNRSLTDTSVSVFRLMALLMPTVMLVMNLAVVAVVWFGGIEIGAGTLQVGQLMALIQYVMQIMFAVMMVSMMAFMIPRGQASANRINEVLDISPDITDPATPQPAVGGGRLAFEHVTFHYPGAEQPALFDISFVATPGQTVAIIGGTGSGKSTLLNLIPRFYDVTSGAITLDGVDVRTMSQADLRAQIGYVPAQAVLFSGSVLDNLRYGDMDASEESAKAALSTAQADDFVAEMDGGVAAELTQGGANLSGGQKQRLSIARALVRQVPLYLFDDCFSALDYRTDAALRQALRQRVSGATVLIVAQRVSTVMDADQILVIDDGRLVGAGTHRQLMADSEVYREIVHSQLLPEEIA
ncbi:MAG: ABC transporter ATP-binding protein [Sulfobacillus sp.]